MGYEEKGICLAGITKPSSSLFSMDFDGPAQFHEGHFSGDREIVLEQVLQLRWG